VLSAATISECGTYRYTLHRRIPCPLRWVRPCLFIMLNPSIADATIDDPTIRRCIGFAKAWSCTELTVVNLFALRATDPKALAAHADPVGPDNDRHIGEQVDAHRLGVVVCAWGAHAFAQERAKVIRAAITGLQCLGVTKDGSPRHPLYVKADQPLVPWPTT
jgi:hypothetical protein